MKKSFTHQGKQNASDDFNVLPIRKSNPETTIAGHFVERVWALEQIRVVLYCDPKHQVPNYGYKKKLSGTSTISQLRKRLHDALGPDIRFVIVLGDGSTHPHGNMILNNARSSYLRKAS